MHSAEAFEHEHLFFEQINIGDEGRQKLREGLIPGISSSQNSLRQKALDFILLKSAQKINAHSKAILIELENLEGNYFSFQELHQFMPSIGSYFGELLVQNEQGDKVIMVYDRDRTASMHQGARYHQTREGGSIHTDNVNIPDPWDFLILACLAPGEVGGESILVDGIKVHQRLQRDFPRALDTLTQNFYWEMRGVADAQYSAPIITYDKKGEPLFRHLRPYMESAHQKVKIPLTPEQLYALDVLDALTNSLEFQIRLSLKKGDLLLSRDAQVLHGRTCFSDSLEAVTYDNYIKGPGGQLKRTMERLWIRKK